MSKKIPALSIFFPFWNEEENIEKVVKYAIPVAQKAAMKWEIIMVDDGSSDNTLTIAKRLVKEDSRLKIVSHKPNRGYGAALKEGFENAKYELVVFNDGDGQFNFSEVSKFIDKISNSDIVVGYRKKRLDHPFRHILMNLLKVWDFIFFGFYYRDIDCGFKMFRKDALNRIMPFKSEGAMITTEIFAKAKKMNLKITQVEVNHYKRQYGNQSGGNLRVIIRAIRESFILWKDINYGRN
ncbi:MAG: glycosyltransferase family 2 protein [Candidatus Levybacteria bacterium]|nr:glycosyltransferase family 2 protein [Candidatus Levybacteria bacterium]